MYYAMDFKITIGNYTLHTLDSVQINKSVEQLSDTAVIVISGTNINRALEVENKIQEGDEVEIYLGYNKGLIIEFKGYLNRIATDDTSIRLECEDALYLFRKNLKNVELKNITLKSLLERVVSEVDAQIEGNRYPFVVNCDYSFTWEKFTIYKATAFDVLKKVQDETKANIYFKPDFTKVSADGRSAQRANFLEIHPQYSEIVNTQPVVYDFSRNIETSSLKYVMQRDKKIEVEVTATLPDGKTKKVTYGTPGGTKKEVTLSTADTASMQARAEQEWNLFAYDGYEGTFTGWLVPVVEPAYKIQLRDKDYAYKDGVYYVVAVETKFESSGGSRTVTLGKKIG
jgi:hypothetical protein